MLIRTRLYWIAILLIILSVVALIFTIKNKNAATCKVMIWASVLAIFYLWASIFLGPLLSVDINLEILFFYLFGAIGTVVYVITIVINVIKRKSIMKTFFATNYSVPQSLKIFLLLLFVLPVLFVSVRIIRDRILIATSDAIVVFYSGGNGGIGDSRLFAFGIQGDKCKPFDLGIDLAVDELVPKNTVSVNTHEGAVILGNYEVILDGDNITILKGNQKVLEYDAYQHGFFNIKVKEGYYKQK